MSTPTFPWQHSRLHLKGKIRVFLLQEVLLALIVSAVSMSEYGHYTAQTQESPLDSDETNKSNFSLAE